MANSLTESRRKIILNSPHIESASGSIVTIDDAIKAKLKSCVVDISPVQEGTGDPSPDNVRPISGWTGCTISQSGADTSDPTTFSISWQSEAGTVYGGTLDVTNGVLRVDRYFDDLSALSWEVKYTDSSNKTLLSNVSRYYKTTATSSDFILENYVARSGVAGTASLSNPDSKNIGFYWYGNSVIETARYLYLVIDINSNPTGKIVYKLATPLTYQLTPTEISTLLGTNNIWADTGDISVKYWAHP